MGWFFVFGAPAAWAMQLGLGWLVSAAACCARHSPPSLSPRAARAAELGITAVALVVALGCVFGGASRRRSSGETLLSVRDRRSFLAAIAWLVSLVLTCAILWAGASSVILPVCERSR
jgi:hypothetical protein